MFIFGTPELVVKIKFSLLSGSFPQPVPTIVTFMLVIGSEKSRLYENALF
jgi:hypothetical protein